MENPIKIDDLGVPLFSETSISKFTDSICDEKTRPLNPNQPKRYYKLFGAQLRVCISNSESVGIFQNPVFLEA